MDYCNALKYTFDVGYTASAICMMIHLLEFFATDKKLSLQGKNLASYCLGTTFAYTCAMVYRIRTTIAYSREMENQMARLLWCGSYNSALLLFNVILSTMLGLRKSSKKSYPADGRDNGTFAFHTIFSWGPTLVVFVLGYKVSVLDLAEIIFLSVLFIYSVCVVLFFLSLYFMRSARINDKRASNSKIKSNVAIRVRLLLVLGAFYVIWISVLVVLSLVTNDLGLMFTFLPCFGNDDYFPILPPFEGIFVFLGFAFWRDTFDDVGTRVDVINDISTPVPSDATT